MTTKLQPCRFTFDDGVLWSGFSHGSTWNGFDNVAVTKDVLYAIIADCDDEDTKEMYREITPMEDGLYSLGWGFSTQIVQTDDEVNLAKGPEPYTEADIQKQQDRLERFFGFGEEDLK